MLFSDDAEGTAANWTASGNGTIMWGINNGILSEEEFTIFTHITLEILERTGSHVLEGDDVRVLVLIKSRLDLFDETILSFSSLLLDTGEIHDLLTLTSRHFYFS